MSAQQTKWLVYLGVLLQFSEGVVFAGPVQRSSRMIREVYPEIEPEKLEGSQAEVCIVGDVVYGAEEPVPADQPCLHCKCQPPGVQCETTRCVKKTGCRAIHKPSKCCPEYQCECEHEGRIYANGERLETPPGGECRVCYCRGGEVQCAEVSCYIRTDCEGRTVPGQCCPKYDHCPPREPLIDRAALYTTSTPPPYLWSSNITADEEISNRISETEPTVAPKLTTQPSNTTLEETGSIHIHELVEKGTQTDPLVDPPKITIQEIIPEIKEIPITGSPKLDVIKPYTASKVAEPLFTDTPLHSKEEENSSDLAIEDTESDSSEISEVYHHLPPVLKIGDQLLFLKKGELVPGKDISTPVPVITIIGAEGLQRGTEDSGEFHEVPSQMQDPTIIEDANEQNETTREHKQTEDTTKLPPLPIEDLLFNITNVNQPANSTQIDASTSLLADDVVNRIKSLTNNLESTTDVAHLVQKIFISDINNISIIEPDSDDYRNISVITTEPSTAMPTSTEDGENSTLIEMRFGDFGEPKPLKHEDEIIPLEQNPEYPPIPDIMSPQNVDELSEHLDPELPQPIFPEEQNDSSANPKTLNITDDAGIIIDEDEESLKNTTTSHPLININAALPPLLLKEVAPGDPEQEDSTPTSVSTETPQGIEFSSNSTTEPNRSKETLESTSEESGELTTSENKHASVMVSAEDASIETTHANSGSQELDMTDLVETIPGIQSSIEESENVSTEKRGVDNPMLKDVEVIEEKLLTTTTTTKPKTEDDAIFEQLNKELKTIPGRVNDNNTGNEEAEAEAIFRELLEEASSSTLSPNNKFGFSKEKESQLLQRVSDAITKYQLKESKESLDASILGILRDFFSSQYRYYDTEQ